MDDEGNGKDEDDEKKRKKKEILCWCGSVLPTAPPSAYWLSVVLSSFAIYENRETPVDAHHCHWPLCWCAGVLVVRKHPHERLLQMLFVTGSRICTTISSPSVWVCHCVPHFPPWRCDGRSSGRKKIAWPHKLTLQSVSVSHLVG